MIKEYQIVKRGIMNRKTLILAIATGGYTVLVEKEPEDRVLFKWGSLRLKLGRGP
jgi:hypothetical protein